MKRKAFIYYLGNYLKLKALNGLECLYCYPEEITDELIDEIASNEKVAKVLRFTNSTYK